MRFLRKAGNPPFGRLACWAIVCFFILLLAAADTVQAADSQNCLACHDGTTDAPDISIFNTNGHGRFGIDCIDCHDSSIPHDDGGRTYSFDSAYYAPAESGVAYAAGYQLKYVNGKVPLMIPANYNITFGYNAQFMKANAFRLCFDCHDSSAVLDDTPGDGIDSNFKASLPNPPRNYSYAWGSGADTNEHVAHIMNYIGPFADSDWDIGTNGPGGADGLDTLTTCTSCHNVHGAGGTHGSTNEAMIRDGSLVARDGYGFSYVIEDVASGGYPWVTSVGATQSTSVGAIFRNNTANMCGGSMCHGSPAPPAGSSYDATGSSWGTYLEYYRPWAYYTDIDRDGDGYSSDVDCDDDDPEVNPGADEICDGIDNDCNGRIDGLQITDSMDVELLMFGDFGEMELTGMVIRITSGTGAGQSRIIVDNNDSAALINVAWNVPPDSSSTFEVVEETAITGQIDAAGNSIYLYPDPYFQISDNPVTDDLIGKTVEITAGNGAGQTREIVRIEDCTLLGGECIVVVSDWDTVPEPTSTYRIVTAEEVFYTGIHDPSGDGYCICSYSPEVCDALDNDCNGLIDDNPSDIDDGNLCTADECIDGMIVNSPVIVDDSVGCTLDYCDLNTGNIIHEPLDEYCDDGDFCNGLETCDAITGCQAGTPLDCDDGDLCTTDSCYPIGGCVFTPVECPAGEQCDSADGICKPEPDCTVDEDCDDGLFCNGAEICDTGTCQAGTPVDCNDGVDCTVDTCYEVNDTCVNTPDDAACPDDGLFCTGEEICDPAAGCVSTGDPCTEGYDCNEDTDTCDRVVAKKVTLCHKGKNTITVGAAAVPAHLAHGDTLGECP